MAEQGTGFTPETWAQFMNMQAPLMQDMMSSYMEQSKSVYLQMQDQLHKQTEQLLGAFGIKR